MQSPFVTAQSSGFLNYGAPCRVAGVNCYFLAYCSDKSRRAALSAAKAMGATVIRCWAFLDVPNFTPGRVAFQYCQDGEILLNDGPLGLERLDALIQAADDFGIRLILPLVNHWKDLGGMPAYVNWISPGSLVTEFYRSPFLRAAYRNWVTQILTRRNTITGRLYVEEPAILAWELTNEARCPIPGGRELLLDWVQEMAALVKRMDTNHLLALGDEGFFYKKGRGHLYNGTYGVDWEANLAVPEIDFGTFHLYPQAWGHANHLDFAAHWIKDHAQVAASCGKPVILEEYGLKLDSRHIKTNQDRSTWYQKWNKTAEEAGVAGSLFWMLGDRSPDTKEYADDFVIYGPEN